MERTPEKNVNKKTFPNLLPSLLLNHGNDYSIFQKDGLKGRSYDQFGKEKFL